MIDGHMDTHTYTHTQATTIPEGQNWPRVKRAAICTVNMQIPKFQVSKLLKDANETTTLTPK